MVLTGKQALDFSGGVSAEDNFGIGGFERIMGPNGQGQYWAPTLQEACRVLMRHYEHTYVVPGERFPRRRPTDDPIDRDVRTAPHTSVAGSDFTLVGDVFSAEHNPERKKPFNIRSVMRAVDRHRLRTARTLVAVAARGDRSRVGRARRRHPGVPAGPRVAHSRPARIPARRRAAELDTPGRCSRSRRARSPGRSTRPAATVPSWCSPTCPASTARRSRCALAARIRRRDRPGGHELPRPDRVRRRFALPRRRIRRVLQAAQRATRDRGGRGLLRLGHRRRTRQPAVVFVKRRRRPDRAGSARGQPARAARGRRRPAECERRCTRRVPQCAPRSWARWQRSSTAIHNIQRALAVGSVDRIIRAADLRPYIIDALERGMARRPRSSALHPAMGRTRRTAATADLPVLSGLAAASSAATVRMKSPNRRHHPGNTGPSTRAR